MLGSATASCYKMLEAGVISKPSLHSVIFQWDCRCSCTQHSARFLWIKSFLSPGLSGVLFICLAEFCLWRSCLALMYVSLKVKNHSTREWLGICVARYMIITMFRRVLGSRHTSFLCTYRPHTSSYNVPCWESTPNSAKMIVRVKTQ